MDNKLKTNKRGQLNGILSLLITGGIMLTIIVITLAIGSEIVDDIRTSSGLLDFPNVNETNLVDNVTADGLTGLGNISGQLGLIGTVIALTVVLLILVALLFRQFAGGKI